MTKCHDFLNFLNFPIFTHYTMCAMSDSAKNPTPTTLIVGVGFGYLRNTDSINLFGVLNNRRQIIIEGFGPPNQFVVTRLGMEYFGTT